MARLVLRPFVGFDACLDGVPLACFDSDKCRAPLAYLVIEGAQSHRRESLAALLWPSPTRRVVERGGRGLDAWLAQGRATQGYEAVLTGRNRDVARSFAEAADMFRFVGLVSALARASGLQIAYLMWFAMAGFAWEQMDQESRLAAESLVRSRQQPDHAMMVLHLGLVAALYSIHALPIAAGLDAQAGQLAAVEDMPAWHASAQLRPGVEVPAARREPGDAFDKSHSLAVYY